MPLAACCERAWRPWRGGGGFHKIGELHDHRSTYQLLKKYSVPGGSASYGHSMRYVGTCERSKFHGTAVPYGWIHTTITLEQGSFVDIWYIITSHSKGKRFLGTRYSCESCIPVGYFIVSCRTKDWPNNIQTAQLSLSSVSAVRYVNRNCRFCRERRNSGSLLKNILLFSLLMLIFPIDVTVTSRAWELSSQMFLFAPILCPCY